MKKWLPSLLPILGTVVTALVPVVRDALVQFVISHPAWATLITAAGLVFNHNLDSPLNAGAAAVKSNVTSTFVIVALGSVLLLSPAHAYSQAATPTPTPTPTATPTPSPTPTSLINPNDGVHIDLSAAFQLTNNSATVNGSDSVTATVLTARVPITDRFSGFVKWITLPKSSATVTLGGVEYRRSVSDFIHSPSLRIDPSKFAVFAYGGLGGKQQDGTTLPGFSGIVGGGLDYNLTSNLVIRAFDIGYLRSSIGTPGEPKGLVLTNHIGLNFGAGVHF